MQGLLYIIRYYKDIGTTPDTHLGEVVQRRLQFFHQVTVGRQSDAFQCQQGTHQRHVVVREMKFEAPHLEVFVG